MRRSLFFPLMTYPDATSESVVASAANFAGKYAADLAGWVVDIAIPHVANPWSLPLIDMPRMVKEAEGTSRNNGARLAALLQECCKTQAVSLDSAKMRLDLPEITDAAAAQARVHDLTVTQSGADFRELNETLVFGSGRPVLLLPAKEWNGAVDHVAIAWDGGRAAARALGDALWLVERAARVSILFSGKDKATSEPAAGRLSEALARRGVQAALRPVDTAGRQIGDALQDEAIAVGADLLVMGGYGHSRLREFVLGGATAGVLSNPLLPVLISH